MSDRGALDLVDKRTASSRRQSFFLLLIRRGANSLLASPGDVGDQLLSVGQVKLEYVRASHAPSARRRPRPAPNLSGGSVLPGGISVILPSVEAPLPLQVYEGRVASALVPPAHLGGASVLDEMASVYGSPVLRTQCS